MRQNILLILSILTILQTKAQSIDFTIMSFNVQQPYGNNWDERKDSAVALLTSQNIDVIGTQEAINTQRNYLIDHTTGYKWYGIGRKGGDNDEGCWIFYKTDKFEIDSANSGNFWLSDTPNKPSSFGDKYNRICTYARLIDKVTGRGLYVYNAHFPTPDLYKGRLSSMKLLMQQVSERTLKYEPVYITGDFNSHETDEVTKWVKSSVSNPLHCRDTYRDVYPTGNVTTGFGAKYDYVYCPNNNKYVTHDSWVVTQPSNASDHMPIAASVSIMYMNNADTLPTADAGPDQTVVLESDSEGNAVISLDGSSSFATGALIEKYEWINGESVVAEGVSVDLDLPEGDYAIFLHVTDTNGNTDSDQVQITIEKEQEEVSSTSVKKLNAIEVFPQPVNDMLYVSSNSGIIDSIKLLDTQGKLLAQVEKQNELTMHEYQTGMYFIEIATGGENYVQRILKR